MLSVPSGRDRSTTKTFDLLTGQFRVDLRDLVLNGFDGALKLADAFPITGKQRDRKCAGPLRESCPAKPKVPLRHVM